MTAAAAVAVTATTAAAFAATVAVPVVIVAVVAAAAATAATTAAAGFGHIIGGRHPAEFEREAQPAADFFLELLQLLLGVHEIGGHRIAEKRVAGGLETADFGGAEFDAGVLFLVKLLAHHVDLAVLLAGGFVVQEPFDAGLKLREHRGPCDFGAEFLGLGENGGIVGQQWHRRIP